MVKKWFSRKKNQQQQPKKTEKDGQQQHASVSYRLSENEKKLKGIFRNCKDIHRETYRFGPQMSSEALTVHCDSIVDESKVHVMKSVLQDLVTHRIGPGKEIQTKDLISFFENKGASFKDYRLLKTMEDVTGDILDGHLVIFIDGWNEALSYDFHSIETRAVEEPSSEVVVKGPHEGTVEDLKKNIGMIRSRLRNPQFKLENLMAGQKTKNEVVFGYLEETVNPEVLKEFKKRVADIDKEEILDTSYIEELIEDSTWSPFPQHRYTERPDVAVSALLEGKILVLVQGSGIILICPGLFVEFFQSPEDYYHRTVYSTMIRFLRISAFFIALTLPSIYIALSSFHPELIPTVLLLAITNTREGIPFPALVEALIMEFFFELLREAGIRLPRSIGSAVSIVGALIIGQAAIDAGLASPIMVVIVALTGIASFSIPQYSIAIALRVVKFPLMFLAATLGGFGLMIGYLLMLLHLSSLRTLGQPYLSPVAPFLSRKNTDVFVRSPLKQKLRSPRKRLASEPPGR